MDNTYNICLVAPFNITKYFKVPVYSVVMLVGLPLNVLALWALILQLKKTIILSVYIINVVLANLLQTLTLPFWIYYSYHNHRWNLSKELCLLVGFAFRTNFYARNNFLCLVAMERYFGVVQPLWFRKMQSMQGATGVSIVSWLLVATLSALGVWLQMPNSTGGQAEYCLDSSQLNNTYSLFRLIIMCVSFFVPCFLMGFFYFRVLCELRKVSSLEKKVKKQMYRFVSLIIATFFFFFAPYQVTSFYRYYWELMLPEDKASKCDFVAGTFLYENITLCFTTLDNIFDPLFYILLLKDIRAEFKRTFSSGPQVQTVPPCSTTRQMEAYVRTEEEIGNVSHTAG